VGWSASVTRARHEWFEAIEIKSYEEKENLFARAGVGFLAYRLERASEPNGSRAFFSSFRNKKRTPRFYGQII
jgi:hypothetical protein